MVSTCCRPSSPIRSTSLSRLGCRNCSGAGSTARPTRGERCGRIWGCRGPRADMRPVRQRPRSERPAAAPTAKMQREQGKKAMSRLLSVALCGIVIAGAAPAMADAVSDFYLGKQIRFIVRTPPGGDYDQYTRLVARFVGKHIPGNPALITVNMPG